MFFPLLIFTGCSGAKKIPVGKENGVYKEVKMNGYEWSTVNKFKRKGLKILFMSVFKTCIVI